MSVNKVQLANGEVLMDVTSDTVTPETLAEGATAHDASGEKITGTMKAGGSSVQSDWNQTDESAADFIKNKPFGDFPAVILEEQELVYDEAYGGCIGILSTGIRAGDTVLSVFEGESYECTAVEENELVIFGNLALLDDGEDTGEPFCCMVADTLLLVIAEDQENHTVKMTSIVPVRIPEKYMPVTKLYVDSVEDMYIYTDVACTVKATLNDIPEHCNFSIGYSDMGLVSIWHAPLFAYNRPVSALIGYGTVMIMREDGTTSKYYTAEYTPTT